jgi:hypothetical protein
VTIGVSRTELTGEFSWGINGQIHETSSRSGWERNAREEEREVRSRDGKVEQEKRVDFCAAANIE